MISIYFEELMITIKMEKGNRLHIFFFCCLNFLFFSLRRSEIYFCWVSCFYFCKITVFIIRNAHLILKTFNNITDIYFFFSHVSYFFSLMGFFYGCIVEFFELYLTPQISFIDLSLSLSCQS